MIVGQSAGDVISIFRRGTDSRSSWASRKIHLPVIWIFNLLRRGECFSFSVWNADEAANHNDSLISVPSKHVTNSWLR